MEGLSQGDPVSEGPRWRQCLLLRWEANSSVREGHSGAPSGRVTFELPLSAAVELSVSIKQCHNPTWVSKEMSELER